MKGENNKIGNHERKKKEKLKTVEVDESNPYGTSSDTWAFARKSDKCQQFNQAVHQPGEPLWTLPGKSSAHYDRLLL